MNIESYIFLIIYILLIIIPTGIMIIIDFKRRIKMINAKEAKKKSQKGREEKVQNQLNEIERAIDGACKDGYFSTYFKDSIYEENKKALKERGYVVTHDEKWDLDLIKWGKEPKKEDNNIKKILKEINQRKRQTNIFFFERGLTVAENIIQDVEGLERGYQDELF